MAYKRSFKPKRKRWSIDAGVKIPGGWGANFKFNSKRSLRKVIKREVKREDKKLAEAKLKGWVPVTPGGLTHNTIALFNPLGNMSQGASQYQKQGDKIQVEGMHLRCIWTPAVSTSTQFLRVLIVKQPVTYGVNANGTATDGFSTGINLSDLEYLNASGVSLSSTGVAAIQMQHDPKKMPILYDKVYRCDQEGPGGLTLARVVDINYNFNTKFEFRPGTNYGLSKNYYVILIPSILGGTTGTSSVGDFSLSGKMIFKDL